MVDVVVSYKHATYSNEALELTRVLEAHHDLRCFPDQREDLSGLTHHQLREYLHDALEEARHVAFFETYSQQVAYAVTSAGGAPTMESAGNRPSWQEAVSGKASSWQEWELQQLPPERYIVLYHSTSPRTIQIGLSGSFTFYSDIPGAAAIISRRAATR